ncbi:MAG: 16S rRNA (guanine(527)-N(7))-methyltransferase RsmG [Spirochaetes bacterium]|nr:16S rRNA (guanine(527)-N(7))-methyltransferase RsmG [Spirochaetota bacterium]
MPKSGIEQIAEAFKSSGIKISNEQLNQFWKFYELFDKYNDEFDLSRIKNFSEIITKHFIDSVLISRYITLPESLVDIGTGPGFPGLPLKIMFPEKFIILAEPKHKRVKFMNMVIDELGIKNVLVYPHKVSDESFFDTDGIITRAFEEINLTLDRAGKFLKTGGKIIFLKGPGVDEDLRKISPENMKNFKCTQDIDYSIPGTSHNRRIVVYEKTGTYREKTFLMMNEFRFESYAITSPENTKYKSYKKIIQKPKGSQLTAVSGKKLILELVSKFPEKCDSIFIYERYCENDADFLNLLDKFEKERKLFLLKKSLFNEIDATGAGQPLMFFEKSEPASFEFDKIKSPVLLIPFQDPTNTGSAIRSAAAFGFTDIVILEDACDPYHPKSVRSSGGAVFYCSIFRGPTINKIAELCSRHGIELITLDKSGTPLSEKTFPEKFMILPGVEGPGLTEDLKKHSVSIEMNPIIDSLNASVAVSILLYKIKETIK